MMKRISVDYSAPSGAIKPMHAVNNGPIRAGSVQCRQNFPEWVEAGIPYARTHDSTLYHGYGGENTVDIDAVFPNFDADETDPASYDFPVTDKYLTTINDAGTEVFYRLGSTIEHWEKKYRVHPPKDFAKWARICEHIIRHYTEGWADGFHYKITYWEIWNEPDGYPACWTGTKEQFFDFFEIAARHLKACFPHLKIGGPAMSTPRAWTEDFLAEMQRRQLPLDFYSWHRYCKQPEDIDRSQKVREMLDSYGFTETESICNEWNYVESWTENFIHSIEFIHSHRGAAFTAACMIRAQNNPIDMLMYYDAQPGVWNGLFNYYTLRPEKTYYAFLFFNRLYRLGKALPTACGDEGLYALAATDGAGTFGMMLAHHGAPGGEVLPELPAGSRFAIRLLDESHNGEAVGEISAGESLFVPEASVIYLEML
ncbi:MAG: hypothetical protein IKL89_04365 [Clostridia bacterium]|nr:hypothetical protein [Clostridia bacterium]